MRLYGQLEQVQLENIAAATTTPASRGRIYADTSNTANIIPRFYDGSNWISFLRGNLEYVSLTAGATLTAAQEFARCDATSSGFTVVLPAAATMTGKLVRIEKTDTTFNAVTIDGNSAELVDGSATIVLNTYREWVLLLCTGTAWLVLATDHYRGKIAYTPTGSWVANTTYTGYWWRTGNRISVEALAVLSGAPTAGALTINYPTGVTLDSSKVLDTTAGRAPIGMASFRDDSTTAIWTGGTRYSSTSAYSVVYDAGAGAMVSLTDVSPVTIANLDRVLAVVLDQPVSGWRG
jgi:hypothetical protein